MLEAMSSAADPWIPILFRTLWTILAICLVIGVVGCVFLVIECKQALRSGHAISECHQLGIEKIKHRRRGLRTA